MIGVNIINVFVPQVLPFLWNAKTNPKSIGGIRLVGVVQSQSQRTPGISRDIKIVVTPTDRFIISSTRYNSSWRPLGQNHPGRCPNQHHMAAKLIPLHLASSQNIRPPTSLCLCDLFTEFVSKRPERIIVLIVQKYSALCYLKYAFLWPPPS